MTKKFTYLLSLILLATVAMTSCKKENSEPEAQEKGNFKLQFGAASMGTKADTEAKAWEKKLKTVTMFVYEGDKSSSNETAIPVYTHVFSNIEIGKLQCVFSIPGITPNGKYEFYVVANKDYSDETARNAVTRKALANEKELLSSGSPVAYKYNDADYVNMTDATKAAAKYEASGYFLMTGMQSATSPAADANKPTTLTVALSRPLAKLEVNAKISKKFIDKYGKGDESQGALGGTLTITKVEIVDVPTEGMILKPTTMPTYTDKTHLTTLEQTNSTVFDQTSADDTKNNHKNLFYFFANAIASNATLHTQPELRITAEYTFDNGEHTTTITYKRLLGGEGTLQEVDDATGQGAFLRNSLYVVNAAINGLTPEEVVATITVTDWTTATTQNIGFGGE